MIRRVVWRGVLSALLALAPASAVVSDTFARYSGHVMEVDLARGVLVVEELGR